MFMFFTKAEFIKASITCFSAHLIKILYTIDIILLYNKSKYVLWILNDFTADKMEYIILLYTSRITKFMDIFYNEIHSREVSVALSWEFLAYIFTNIDNAKFHEINETTKSFETVS